MRIPNVRDMRIRETLAGCWEQTKDIVVPQFSHGECEVRELLNTEPHVRGLGYNQYGDEIEDIEDMETDPDDETAEDQG